MSDIAPEISSFNKKIFILVTIILVILISIAIFMSQQTQSKLSKLDTLPKTQEGISQAVDSVKVESKEELRIENCDKLAEIERTAICYIQTAVYEKDDKYCNLFPQEYIKLCKDHVNFAIAVNNKDLSTCEKFDNIRIKDSCIQSIAVKSLDPILCERLNNKSTSSIGEGLFTAYDECYGKIADYTNNTLLCANILGEEAKNSCYSILGARLNDKTICSKISGKQADFYLHQCLIIIVRTTVKELSECNQFSDSRIVKECSLFIAEKDQNFSICDDLYPEDILLKDENSAPTGTRAATPLESCYGKFIANIADYNKCKVITNLFWKDYCILNTAVLNKDSTICEGMSNQDVQKNCVASVEREI